jgi:hypothetical protein
MIPGWRRPDFPAGSRLSFRGPYTDWHDWWVGVYWRPEPDGGLGVYVVPVPVFGVMKITVKPAPGARP